MANSISDFLHSYSLRVFDNLPVPILTVTGEGTAGTTLYEYKATFKTLVGESLPSSAVSLATGNATLTGFNKNRLSVSDIPQATTKVRYWKNAWTYYSQTVRENSTAYVLGDYMVLAANSQVRYQCTFAGTSASADPGAWPTTLGNTKTDGTVIWTAVTNKNDSWVLLGEVDPDPGQIYDTGQATTSATVPTTDTSGRPGVIAILPKPGTMIQRAERIDTMSLFSQMVQDGFDLIHRSGDVIGGCNEYQIDGNLWGFTAGQIYFLGRFINVPAGQVTLTGVGEEKVGLTITPLYETPDDDHVWRCGEDEGVAGEYANTGPDVLYFEFAWVKDVDGLVLIKEFVGGVPKTATLSPERTELDRMIARRTMAVSGSFCVENFPLQVVDHATDESQLTLKIGAGYAFPNGFEVKTVGTRTVDFDKARDVESVNNSGVDIFNERGAVNEWTYWQATTVYAVGAIVVPSILTGYRMKVTARAGNFKSGASEPTWSETPGATIADNNLTWTVLGNDYDLNTLALTVKVGSGNTHTVTFVANNLTAAQVVSAIETQLNAYPTSGEPDLVNAVNAEALLQLYSADGKSLTLGGTALAQLGWAAGTTLTEGTRIYEVNDSFVKTVTDMNYKIEQVVQITHNGTTHKDLLGSNVVAILGASTLVADCHDSKWTYVENIDWVKDGNYISFDGMGGSEPGSGATYFVKCQMNLNATKGSRHLCRVIDAKVVKTGEDLADNLTFTDATSITRISTGATVVPAGAPKDVVSILRVNNSPGQSTTQYTSHALLKNSGALTHETSQVDWSEAGTQGVVITGQPSDSATYYVSFDFWHHAVEGDYVCADSYDNYPSIEMAPNGVLPLRDCIDFRTSGGYRPMHGEDPTFDYEFYLARIDKLTIDDAGNFQLLTGAPAINPPTPSEQNGTLSLAVLRISPYTYFTSSVNVVSVEPLRITQKGIQRLQERIERLEYWQAINSLESEAEGSVPTGSDTQGIFTDALTGWGRMDLGFSRNGITCNAALDRINRCLLLNYEETSKLISVDENNSIHIRRAGNSVMLDYAPEVFMEQSKASVWVNGATDYDYSSYFGRMNITPQTHTWLDTQQLPQINVDFDNQFTALIDVANQYLSEQPIDWGAWSNGEPNRVLNATTGWWSTVEESGYGGLLANHNFGYFGYGAGSLGTTSRTGTTTSLIPGAITRETINAVADLSLQYHMSTTDADGNPFEIQLDIIGLMPNVDHACTINGIPVDLTYDNSPVNASGGVGTHAYSGKTTATTSNIGSLTAKFVMPTGVLTGTAIIRVFYYSNPDISTCWANFFSAGFTIQEQQTALGFPSVATQDTIYTESGESYWYYDPLAQTFTLPSAQYISAVGLFFKSKSSTLGYRVELWKVDGGVPVRDSNTPYAMKHLPSSDIVISNDASAETVFTFDNVLSYSKNQEWAFVGFPDSSNTDYNLWCSEVGTIDVSSETRITTHPHSGTLLHSPNTSTWSSEQPWSKRDLKFKLYKSNFEDSCSIIFDNLTGLQAARFILKFDEYVGSGTNVRWSYSVDGGGTYTAFNPYIDQDFGDSITQVKLRANVTSLGGSYEIIDKYVGIYLRYFNSSANYITTNEFFTDALLYPNCIVATLVLDTDSINYGTGTLVTCYASVDDGFTWFVVPVKEGYTSVADETPYYMHMFQTPDTATITDATNASPIVVTSTGHGFTNNMIITVASVGGNTNANGDWVVTNATANTFELYTVAGVASAGNSAYTSGGSIVLKEFEQMRGRVGLFTSEQHRTPRVKKISFVASAV